jgi:type I restriction enzyme S subunit
MNFDKLNYHIQQAQLPEGNALNLPKGWEKQRLEACFKLKSGDGLTSKMMSEDGEYPVYGGNGIAGLHNEYNLSGSNVIIGRVGALCGNVRHMDAMIWLTDNAFKITDFKFDFDHSFLTYLLNFKNLREYARQAAQPVISNSSLKDVILEFPKSLPEQQRIVSILDKCFSAIERSRNNAEQNLKNAKELFESYLQGVFEKKGDGWVEKTLGEVLIKTKTIDPTKSPDAEFTYLDVSSVNKETKEIENTVILLGKDAPSRARKLVKTNDVIFATVRPTHSRVALITEEYNEQVCSTGYIVLRAKEYLNNNLVFYFLLTYGFNKQMEKLQKGASYPAVTDSEVKGIYIPYPKSLTEQLTIVHQLDTLRAETQKMEAIYQKKIADLEELKKSILQKAFAGELKVSELGWVGLKDDKIKMNTK